MTLETGSAAAWKGETLVAKSDAAVIVRESGRSPYPPVAYFPRDALIGATLAPKPQTTVCPLKGTASYFDLRLGDASVEDGVWSYEVVLDFDEGLERLRNLLGFDGRSFRVEIDAP